MCAGKGESSGYASGYDCWWYAERAVAVWAGSDRPTLKQVRRHAKGLRLKGTKTREYFSKYRAARTVKAAAQGPGLSAQDRAPEDESPPPPLPLSPPRPPLAACATERFCAAQPSTQGLGFGAPVLSVPQLVPMGGAWAMPGALPRNLGPTVLTHEISAGHGSSSSDDAGGGDGRAQKRRRLDVEGPPAVRRAGSTSRRWEADDDMDSINGSAADDDDEGYDGRCDVHDDEGATAVGGVDSGAGHNPAATGGGGGCDSPAETYGHGMAEAMHAASSQVTAQRSPLPEAAPEQVPPLLGRPSHEHPDLASADGNSQAQQLLPVAVQEGEPSLPPPQQGAAARSSAVQQTAPAEPPQAQPGRMVVAAAAAAAAAEAAASGAAAEGSRSTSSSMAATSATHTSHHCAPVRAAAADAPDPSASTGTGTPPAGASEDGSCGAADGSGGVGSDSSSRRSAGVPLPCAASLGLAPITTGAPQHLYVLERPAAAPADAGTPPAPPPVSGDGAAFALLRSNGQLSIGASACSACKVAVFPDGVHGMWAASAPPKDALDGSPRFLNAFKAAAASLDPNILPLTSSVLSALPSPGSLLPQSSNIITTGNSIERSVPPLLLGAGSSKPLAPSNSGSKQLQHAAGPAPGPGHGSGPAPTLLHATASPGPSRFGGCRQPLLQPAGAVLRLPAEGVSHQPQERSMGTQAGNSCTPLASWDGPAGDPTLRSQMAYDGSTPCGSTPTQAAGGAERVSPRLLQPASAVLPPPWGPAPQQQQQEHCSPTSAPTGGAVPSLLQPAPRATAAARPAADPEDTADDAVSSCGSREPPLQERPSLQLTVQYGPVDPAQLAAAAGMPQQPLHQLPPPAAYMQHQPCCSATTTSTTALQPVSAGAYHPVPPHHHLPAQYQHAPLGSHPAAGPATQQGCALSAGAQPAATATAQQGGSWAPQAQPGYMPQQQYHHHQQVGALHGHGQEAVAVPSAALPQYCGQQHYVQAHAPSLQAGMPQAPQQQPSATYVQQQQTQYHHAAYAAPQQQQYLHYQQPPQLPPPPSQQQPALVAQAALPLCGPALAYAPLQRQPQQLAAAGTAHAGYHATAQPQSFVAGATSAEMHHPNLQQQQQQTAAGERWPSGSSSTAAPTYALATPLQPLSALGEPRTPTAGSAEHHHQQQLPLSAQHLSATYWDDVERCPGYFVTPTKAVQRPPQQPEASSTGHTNSSLASLASPQGWPAGYTPLPSLTLLSSSTPSSLPSAFSGATFQLSPGGPETSPLQQQQQQQQEQVAAMPSAAAQQGQQQFQHHATSAAQPQQYVQQAGQAVLQYGAAPYAAPAPAQHVQYATAVATMAAAPSTACCPPAQAQCQLATQQQQQGHGMAHAYHQHQQQQQYTQACAPGAPQQAASCSACECVNCLNARRAGQPQQQYHMGQPLQLQPQPLHMPAVSVPPAPGCTPSYSYPAPLTHTHSELHLQQQQQHHGYAVPHVGPNTVACGPPPYAAAASYAHQQPQVQQQQYMVSQGAVQQPSFAATTQASHSGPPPQLPPLSRRSAQGAAPTSGPGGYCAQPAPGQQQMALQAAGAPAGMYSDALTTEQLQQPQAQQQMPGAVPYAGYNGYTLRAQSCAQMPQMAAGPIGHAGGMHPQVQAQQRHGRTAHAAPGYAAQHAAPQRLLSSSGGGQYHYHGSSGGGATISQPLPLSQGALAIATELSAAAPAHKAQHSAASAPRGAGSCRALPAALVDDEDAMWADDPLSMWNMRRTST